MKIAEASEGRIEAVRSSDCDINWGRRFADDATLNPATMSSANKHVMRQRFAEHDVPAPKFYEPDDALIRLGLNAHTDSPVTLIGRPSYHTRRQGFWVCNTLEEGQWALLGRGGKKAATHFVEMVYLEREFRVHVFNGKSIRISEKEFTEDGDYTTVKPSFTRRRHIRDAAKAAVESVGLNFGCVDILADAEHAYALEVNAAPGLGGSMPTLWANTFIKHFEEE